MAKKKASKSKSGKGKKPLLKIYLVVGGADGYEWAGDILLNAMVQTAQNTFSELFGDEDGEDNVPQLGNNPTEGTPSVDNLKNPEEVESQPQKLAFDTVDEPPTLGSFIDAKVAAAADLQMRICMVEDPALRSALFRDLANFLM